MKPDDCVRIDPETACSSLRLAVGARDLRGRAHELYHRSARESTLVLAPHQDDDLLAGADSSARRRLAGRDVHVVYVTDGLSVAPRAPIPARSRFALRPGGPARRGPRSGVLASILREFNFLGAVPRHAQPTRARRGRGARGPNAALLHAVRRRKSSLRAATTAQRARRSVSNFAARLCGQRHRARVREFRHLAVVESPGSCGENCAAPARGACDFRGYDS